MNFDFIIFGILCIVPSVLHLIFPEFILTFGKKWKYEDATPTDNALVMSKIISIIVLIIGICLFVYGLFEVPIKDFFGFNYFPDTTEMIIIPTKDGFSNQSFTL